MKRMSKLHRWIIIFSLVWVAITLTLALEARQFKSEHFLSILFCSLLILSITVFRKPLVRMLEGVVGLFLLLYIVSAVISYFTGPEGMSIMDWIYTNMRVMTGDPKFGGKNVLAFWFVLLVLAVLLGYDKEEELENNLSTTEGVKSFAIYCATRHYEDNNISVQELGSSSMYDLKVKKGTKTYNIFVLGFASQSQSNSLDTAQITDAKNNPEQTIFCVVFGTPKSPKFEEFIWDTEKARWCCEERYLKLQEVSAVTIDVCSEKGKSWMDRLSSLKDKMSL